MNRKTVYSVLIAFLCSSSAVTAQVLPLTFAELEAKQKSQPKPVLVFLYTNWCSICEGMKLTTFKNPEVIKLLNTEFYTIFLNAEETNEIVYQGRKFNFVPSGAGTGTHQLAQQFADDKGQLAYPSICFLSTESKLMYWYDGFLDAISLIKTAQIMMQNQK